MREIVRFADDFRGGFDWSVQHNPMRRCCYAEASGYIAR